MFQFTNSLDSLMFQKKGKSRCINQENPRGEKGKGGMAAGSLGPGRKGSGDSEEDRAGRDESAGGDGRTGCHSAYLDDGYRPYGKGLLCAARPGSADLLGR